MNRWSIILALVVCSVSSDSWASLPDRATLLESPQYAEEQAEPTFVEYRAEDLTQQIKVISSRSYAVFGFNTPEVQLLLPHSDNNVYATAEFHEPRLIDGSGATVKYEPERGIYDHDTFSDELRFTPVGPEDGPVSFARAEGTITLTYPLQIKTVVISNQGGAAGGLDIAIDGPFVTVRGKGVELAEPASFTPFHQPRVYDGSGRQLKANPSTSYELHNDVRSETLSYWGAVAEVRVDLVVAWAKLEISYSLPPVAPLPPGRAGSPPDPAAPPAASPGGTVSITSVEVSSPADASSPASLSQEEALAQLAPLGVRSVDPSALVMATMHGKREAVEILLAAGVPVDGRHIGMTALLAAAMYGQPEVGLLLIEAGADVNAVDSNDSTALIWAAAKCRSTELVQALIDAGADVEATAKGGGKALMMADAVGCTDNARALRAAGAR